MDEYQEIVREFFRMCKNIRETNHNICDRCPIKIASLGTVFNCYRYILEFPKESEDIVMRWAAEHPEPVYPTFGEWLEKQGIVKLVNIDRYEEDRRKVYMLLESVENQIPADLAQKLGIEPKEGTC